MWLISLLPIPSRAPPGPGDGVFFERSEDPMASTSVPSTVVKNSRNGWHEELVTAHLDLGQVASRLEGLITRLVGPAAVDPAPGAATNAAQGASQGATGVFDQVAEKARAIKGVNGRISAALDRLEEMLPE
jgi:hypothetical protein